jgi:hypothetical protein
VALAEPPAYGVPGGFSSGGGSFGGFSSGISGGSGFGGGGGAGGAGQVFRHVSPEIKEVCPQSAICIVP